MKEKRGSNVPVIILTFLGIVTLSLVLSFIYLSLNGPNYTEAYIQKIATGEIKNPLTEFGFNSTKEDESTEEFNGNEKNESITGEFKDAEENESKIGEGIIKNQTIPNIELIRYAATLLKLYNLHTTPYTKVTPKIQIDLNQETYSIEIITGEIIITEGEIQNKDIIIRTTREELLKINENTDYIKESISSGKTTIEKIASDFILFSKGYSVLYPELE